MRIDRRTLFPLTVFTAFAAAMVSPLLFAGKIYYFRDFGRYYLPVKKYYLDRLAAGEFPLWIPAMNCGTPVHGELVHGLLYPGNVLLFAGDSVGWGLYFAAHLLLAAVGMRALALRLGAAREGAFAAGLAFAGSGYFVSQLNHVPYATAAAWAPVIVWLCLGAGTGKRGTIPFLAMAFAMAALAGEPFTIVLTLTFAAILLLAGLGGPRRPAFFQVGIAGFIGILLASPSLIPALVQMGESARAGGIDVDEEGFGSLHPARLMTVLSPESMGRLQQIFIDRYDLPIFGEIKVPTPILLGVNLGALTLVAAFTAPVRRSRVVRLLLIVVGVFLVLALGSYLRLGTLLFEYVPGLSSFRYPDKYWLVVTLAAVPLLGLALPGLRRRPTLIVSLVLAGLSFGAALLFKRPVEGLMGAAPFLLIALASRLPKAWWTGALTTILAAELLFFGLRHHGVSEPEDMYPMPRLMQVLRQQAPGRMFVDYKLPEKTFTHDVKNQTEILSQRLESMIGIPFGIHYTMGYDPVEPLGRIPRFFGLPVKLTPQRRTLLFHRLLRLSANTHSFTNINLSGDQQVRMAIHIDPHDIAAYAYRKPLARARLYGNTVRVPDADAARKKLHDLEFDPYTNLLLEGEGPDERRGVPSGQVLWEHDGDREVRLRVFSDREAWLFLSDAWSEAWNAWVDGEPADLEIALIAFRGVRVPKGESVVTFRYEPGWLRVVPITAGVGILLLLGAFLRDRRRRRGRGISDSDRGSDRTSDADGR